MTATVPTILVLGATGTIGGEVARQLFARPASVRVGVRTPSKADALERAGAEVKRFDFDARSTWSAALAGVDRLFVVAPFVAGFAEPVEALIAAAKAAGVQHIVKLSAMGVSDEAPFELGRQHARADASLQASGLSHTILRPTFFMDNIFNFHGHTIEADGAFYGASGGQSMAYVSSRDIGAVGVEALLNPSVHDGQIYVLTGGEALTDDAVAQRVGDALHKPVQFVDLPLEHLQAGMESQDGMPDWLVEALVALENVKAQGWASQVSPDVQKVLGRSPERFDTWLADRVS
jgi:uncharacterized protein YbjT (DUF2867 family)